MIVIYGLGNNDKKYLNTKHNVGRLLLEMFATSEKVSFKTSSSQKSFNSAKNPQINLVYSNGYMNLSGKPLFDFWQYFKLSDSNQENILIVLQDDSDQFEGCNKLVLGGGSAGHRGLNSIYEYLSLMGLKKENIWRLKIGIRPLENKLKSETFVLNSITTEDTLNLNKLLETIQNNKQNLLESRFNLLQNQINTK